MSALARRPGIVAALVAGLVSAAVGTASGQPAHAASRPATALPVARGTAVPDSYLGVWNYDQPDRQTMVDYAVISCPAGEPSCATMPSIVIPQIGYVVFAAAPGGAVTAGAVTAGAVTGGAVTGHTDQGCTWRFAVVPGGLELSPARQYCFNHVVGSGYTITRWSVRFSGQHEMETVDAVSHLPNGDFDFVLQDGKRTKASNRPVADRFAGYWRYDPANQATGVNMQTVQTTGPGSTVTVSRVPMTGTVTITGASHLITARTANGCRWTLEVSGNTAELAPATQTCDRAGSVTTIRFWAIACDGQHQISIITGTYPDGSTFQLTNGSLTRSWLSTVQRREKR